jgi:hypothetical protein
MHFISVKLTFCAVLLLCSALFAVKPAIETPDIPVRPGGIRPLLQSSGYAFSGTVTSVKSVSPGQMSGIGATQITFHVASAVRGVQTGQTLVISEWAGLWQMGERYRPGERVFLFLYPPSKLGFTSPVQGSAGRFMVRDGGMVVIRPEQRTGLPSNLGKRVGTGNSIDLHEFTRELRVADEEQP